MAVDDDLARALPGEPSASGYHALERGARTRSFALAVSIVLAGIVALTFADAVWRGIGLYEIGDELEHFVVAQLLNRGAHLYRDVFSHHGPFLYAVAQVWTWIGGE